MDRPRGDTSPCAVSQEHLAFYRERSRSEGRQQAALALLYCVVVRTPVPGIVRLRGCVHGILSQVCPLSRFSLLLTCASCVEIEDIIAALFLSARWKTELRLVPHPETLGFPSEMRLSSRLIQIRPQYLHPCNYRPFKVIQGNTVTLARICRNMGNASKPHSTN